MSGGSGSTQDLIFRRASELSLKNAKLVAFGSTRRKNITVEDDANVKALLAADTER